MKTTKFFLYFIAMFSFDLLIIEILMTLFSKIQNTIAFQINPFSNQLYILIVVIAFATSISQSIIYKIVLESFINKDNPFRESIFVAILPIVHIVILLSIVSLNFNFSLNTLSSLNMLINTGLVIGLFHIYMRYRKLIYNYSSSIHSNNSITGKFKSHKEKAEFQQMQIQKDQEMVLDYTEFIKNRF